MQIGGKSRFKSKSSLTVKFYFGADFSEYFPLSLADRADVRRVFSVDDISALFAVPQLLFDFGSLLCLGLDGWGGFFLCRFNWLFCHRCAICSLLFFYGSTLGNLR